MIRTVSSTIHRALHCRPGTGFAAAMALFGIEGVYSLLGSQTRIGSSKFDAIWEWLNPDQFIQSGTCRWNLTPNIS